MSSLPIPRSAALALVLHPMPIYLDLRKDFCYDNGNLGSAWIVFKNSCILSKIMNPLVFVMKYLLFSPPSSNLLQFSRNLLFVSHVNWLVLNTKFLKSTNQWRLNKIEKELQLEMPTKMVILFLLIYMLSTLPANCFQVMEEKHLTISFMVVHCSMTRLQVLSGMRIKSLLELEKLWWLRNALNNGYGNLAAAEIHHLHSNNGIFNAELFVKDCKNKFQTQSFSGVGAYHQNTLPEQSIQMAI